MPLLETSKRLERDGAMADGLKYTREDFKIKKE